MQLSVSISVIYPKVGYDHGMVRTTCGPIVYANGTGRRCHTLDSQEELRSRVIELRDALGCQ
jgi:hypothetical protein